MANLYFEATLDATQLKKGIADTQRRVQGLTKNVKQQGAEMDSTFKRIGAAMAGYFSITAAKGFINQMVKVRGEFQQLDIALQTMLGSKAQADTLMAEVVELAAKTPFSLTELGQGAKRLLAFKEPVDQVGDSLRRLGDLAAGASAPIGDLIQVYGKVSAKGKMQAEELNQFAERGIPIISELAKVVGATDKEIYKMAEHGKIGFPELQQAIKNMTNEGGMFFNLMEKQSASLTGQISNMGDAWDRALNEMGKNNEGALNSSIAGITFLIDNYETVIDTLKVIIATYGAYRGAIVAANLAIKAQAAMGAVQAWVSLAKGIRSAKDAQLAFNLASKMNPWGLAAAGIAALVTGFALFANKAKSTQDIIQDLDNSISNYSNTAKDVDKLANEFETLRGKTERTKDENDRLNTVMESLSKSVPDVVSEFDEYGRVLDINIEKVKEFSAEQKLASNISLTNSLEEAEKDLIRVNKELESLRKVFQEGVGEYTTSTATGGTRVVRYKATEDEITKAADKANEKYAEREKLLNSIANAQSKLSLLASTETASTQKTETDPAPDAENTLEKYKTLLSEQKKAYDEYNDAMRAARDEDKAGIEEYYKNLTSQGEDYEQYLKNQLEAFRGNVEAKTAIYQAAASAKIEIDPDRPNKIDRRPGTSSIGAASSIAPSNQDVAKLREAQQRYAAIYEKIRETTKSQQNADMAGNMIEAAYAGQDLANAVGQFDKGLGDALMKMADVTGSIGNMVGALSSGNPIEMVGAAVTMIASLGSLFDNSASKQREAALEAEKLRNLFELQNRELERQIELMNQASGEDRVKEERATMALIKKQQKENLDRIKAAKLTVDTGIYNPIAGENATYDVALNLTEGNEIKELEAKIRETTEAGYNIKNQDKLLEMLDEYYRLQGLQKDVTENIVGTTAGDIADAIVQGFKDGKSAIEDFADTFEDLMIDAVMNSFKTQAIMAAVQPFYDEMEARMEDGVLDADDTAFLTGMWEKIMKDMGLKFEGVKGMLTEGLGYDPFAAMKEDSLSGAIKGVSEQTASILAGQMNSIRINQAESLRIMNESVRYQAQIAMNTNYNHHLEGIHSEIRAMRASGADLKSKGF